MNTIKKIINRLISVFVYIGGILILFSVIMATINAISRKFFNTSFTWAEELCTYSVVIGFFISIPYLELKNRELKVDILASTVKNNSLLKCLYILFGCAEMALFASLIRFGIISVQSAMSSGVTTNYMHIPKWYLYSVAVCSFALSIISWVGIFLNKGESYK